MPVPTAGPSAEEPGDDEALCFCPTMFRGLGSLNCAECSKPRHVEVNPNTGNGLGVHDVPSCHCDLLTVTVKESVKCTADTGETKCRTEFLPKIMTPNTLLARWKELALKHVIHLEHARVPRCCVAGVQRHGADPLRSLHPGLRGERGF